MHRNDYQYGISGIEIPRVPKIFNFLIFSFFIITGSISQILQLLINGIENSGTNNGFLFAIITGFIYDLLRVSPIFLFGRSQLGLLHPLILAVVIWPLLVALPNAIDDLGGYSGLLAGERLSAPFFYALGHLSQDQIWFQIAKTNALNCFSLLALFAGYFALTRRSKFSLNKNKFNTLSLRRVLIAIILVNFFGVLAFIELRGGLDEHLFSLGSGRFRALAGLGPLLSLFDVGFFALLIWIASRPQDARNLIFIILMPAVALQQFLTAGSRSAALAVLIMVGLTWSMRVRRIPWRLAVLLLPVAFLSLGLFNLIRTSSYSDQTASQVLSTVDLETVLERTKTEFAERRALSGSVPVIADGHRVTNGPLYGETYLGAVFAMVPRALWPDKPRGPGSFYSMAFLGEEREGQAVPIGPVAESYWNFGFLGVILAFFLQGCVLRYAQTWYEANLENGIVVVLFVQIATQFQIYTDSLVAFQQMLVTLFIVLLIVRLFVRTEGSYEVPTSIHRTANNFGWREPRNH